MSAEIGWAIKMAVVTAAVFAYYGFIVPKVGDYPARRLLPVLIDRAPVRWGYSADELDSILRLSIAGLMQLLFCGLLILLAGVDPARLMPERIRPALLVLGVLLGLADAALGAHIAYLAMRVAMKLVPAHVPNEVSSWLAMSRGGWIRFYLRTASAAPIWLALPIAILYVAMEEVIFRGTLINSMYGASPAAVVAFSVMLFMAVQVFSMPSWQSAFFPVIGALVIGLAHALLYLAVPDLLPLIVAHVVAFEVAIL